MRSQTARLLPDLTLVHAGRSRTCWKWQLAGSRRVLSAYASAAEALELVIWGGSSSWISYLPAALGQKVWSLGSNRRPLYGRGSLSLGVGLLHI